MMEYKMELNVEGYIYNVECAPHDDGYAYAIYGEGLISGMDGFTTMNDATHNAVGEAIKHSAMLDRVARVITESEGDDGG